MRWEHKWIYPLVLENHRQYIENENKGIRSLERTSMEEKEDLVEEQSSIELGRIGSKLPCPYPFSVYLLPFNISQVHCGMSK